MQKKSQNYATLNTSNWPELPRNGTEVPHIPKNWNKKLRYHVYLKTGMKYNEMGLMLSHIPKTELKYQEMQKICLLKWMTFLKTELKSDLPVKNNPLLDPSPLTPSQAILRILVRIWMTRSCRFLLHIVRNIWPFPTGESAHLFIHALVI